MSRKEIEVIPNICFLLLVGARLSCPPFVALLSVYQECLINHLMNQWRNKSSPSKKINPGVFINDPAYLFTKLDVQHYRYAHRAQHLLYLTTKWPE